MRILFAALLLGLTACTPTAQPSSVSQAHSADDCTEQRPLERRFVACETREFTLDASPLRVDATPNGGISVRAWDRDDVQVRATVKAWARTQPAADALLSEVTVETRGSVRARLPNSRDDAWASVSYEIMVPRDAEVDLRTVNGGISVHEVEGVTRFSAVNGGVFLNNLSGDVTGQTTNGGIDVHLAKGLWRGAGMDVRTQNGGIEVEVASGVSAEIDAKTAMGPVQFSGLALEDVRCGETRSRQRPCMGGHAVGTLGRGGAPLRFETTNGGIRLRRE